MTNNMPKSDPDSVEPRSTVAGLEWVKKSEWPEHSLSSSSQINTVDLFCSFGGMTLGVWEGARRVNRRTSIKFAVDLVPETTLVYKNNFGCISSNIKTDDVARIFCGSEGEPIKNVERYWKSKIGSIDLIVAGPPCQGHSDLNNSTRRADPRNQLYLRVARAAEILKPKVIVIENVPAVSLDSGKVVPTASAWLEQMGYGVSTMVVNMSQFGVPQKRKRHILLAVYNGKFELETLVDVNRRPETIGDYLAGLEDSAGENGLMSTPSKMTQKNSGRVKFLFENDLYNLPDTQRPPCHRDKKHAYPSMYGRMLWNEPAQTLTSGFGSMGQGRYVHPKRRRLITPHEAARLQGIPDFFDFGSVTKLSILREMIANAVPPQFTANLTSRLVEEGLL